MSDKSKRITELFLKAQDRLVLQASDMSPESISQMVASGAVDIRPKYQRRERWTSEKQSALIESFLLNVPIPPVYLSEDDFGIYSVIDGKQRITAISRFMSNELKLHDLESFPELNGFRLNDLPPEPKNALRVRPYFRVVTLLKQSDPALKYEVFTRLNRGGEPLNPQEIRNVLFRGLLNEAIYKLSEQTFLRQQLKIRSESSAAYKTMQDAELVLRYFTLTNTWDHFSGDYRRSMDQFMRDYKDISKKSADSLKKSFVRSLDYAEAVWGEAAFKRPQGDSWRDQLLAGMYDAQMVAISELSNSVLDAAVKDRQRVIRDTRAAFKDSEFEDAVRTATNTPAKVKYRIDKMIDILF